MNFILWRRPMLQSQVSSLPVGSGIAPTYSRLHLLQFGEIHTHFIFVFCLYWSAFKTDDFFSVRDCCLRQLSWCVAMNQNTNYAPAAKQYSFMAHYSNIKRWWNATTSRGGATVLKVGGTILRAERAKKIFLTPHFLASWGGDKILLR